MIIRYFCFRYILKLFSKDYLILTSLSFLSTVINLWKTFFYIYLYVCVCGSRFHSVCVKFSGQFAEVDSFLQGMAPRDWTQVINQTWWKTHICPLSHFAGLVTLVVWKTIPWQLIQGQGLDLGRPLHCLNSQCCRVDQLILSLGAIWVTGCRHSWSYPALFFLTFFQIVTCFWNFFYCLLSWCWGLNPRLLATELYP